MSGWMLGLLLKPFILFALFFTAAVIARVVLHFIPEGRVKRLLTRRAGPN